MSYSARPYHPEATIAAVATAPGEGGIAVIRISGAEAMPIARRLFRGAHHLQSHTAHFGQIVSEEGEAIDDVLLLPMLAPRSYTGEDVVEIHCHGGRLITRRVLERVFGAGALPAGPGEFTMRAFLNGKLDLAQAEAVQEVIAARSGLALDAAQQQLQGALSRKVTTWYEQLVDITATLEAWVDFPDEGLEFLSSEELVQQLQTLRAPIERLLATFQQGKLVREGLALCLAGPPNVGKSSLLNALLGRERAIVADLPGTTRDTLEEELSISGCKFRIIDTAGIRETEETIEREGVKRSHRAMREADLTLLVLDATTTAAETEWISSLPSARTLLVWNKIDLLPESVSLPELLPHTVAISAKEEQGLDALRSKIVALTWQDGLPERGEVLLTELRHAEALAAASRALQDAIAALQGNLSPEFPAADTRSALLQLGMILGREMGEEVLDAIFIKFCIGK